MGRIDPFEDKGNSDGRILGLLCNLKVQHPNFLGQMFNLSAIEARRSARELNLAASSGSTFNQRIVKIPERAHNAVQVLAGKLSIATYYLETGKIFPTTGELMFNWFSNEVVFKGSNPVFEALSIFSVKQRKIVRAGKNLSDHFDYRYSISNDHDLAILQAVFGRSFGLVTIARTRDGVLEGIVKAANKKTGVNGNPFIFI